MVEGARLESVFRGNSNVGSNPTLSAIDQMYLQSQLDVAGSARSDAWGAKSNVVSSAYLS